MPRCQPRTVALCPDLARLINQDKALRRFFEALGYSARREINDWVAEPKNAETRERRAYRLAERLLETMEAERELPPLIRAAFDRNHAARDGWQRMTLLQHRRELLSIFYYRNPESRNRRLEKTIQMAADYSKLR